MSAALSAPLGAPLSEWIAAALVLLGGAFCLVAAIGVVRMPDVYTRMHASTKAGTLGVGLLAVALAVGSPVGTVTVKAIAVVVFLIATAPIGAHLIGRAAYRSGVPFWPGTVIEPAVHETFPRDPTPGNRGAVEDLPPSARPDDRVGG
ncbi:monovalent cation/H(+) antiporter subunit G [Roseospira goensis]|uniref:Multicomponent Na+:H+ antiporter subunit G n=1 Tax=Roseospira goensis TaxID=391922 RepID=A0A7W6WK64_9PROT|nr:monovalent cation/H(+) antiporter subunit G [Roseospira goensis]MBB4285092.1 multicomponent Na+:H+ antiporter subunit G [Roseospira goensis]